MFTVASPMRLVIYIKESVEMISVYLLEGSDKTQAKTNDTMPHTWIVWDMRKELHSHITIQEIGVVRLSFCF